MATFTVTVPDAQLQPLLDGICRARGYDAKSGLTPQQFAEKMLVNHLHGFILDQQAYQARQAAQQALQGAGVTVQASAPAPPAA